MLGCGRRAERLRELKLELPSAEFFTCDVTAEAEVCALAEGLAGRDLSQSGHSLTMFSAGFYSAEYVDTWVIPDGAPLPQFVKPT